MLALLAPAKTLDLTPGVLVPTRPTFAADAAQLAEVVAGLGAARLKRLMKLSDAKAKAVLADLARFEADARGVAAAHAFRGEVFKAFEGWTLSEADLSWAQDRVGILSGLYGLLRPLDGVLAHRLEMSARLPTPRGHNLYAFWGERLTRRVNELTEGHADRSVLNLASQEYIKAIWPRSLAGPLLEVVFENWKDAARTPHTIPTPSRRARGLMARFIVERRARQPSDLLAFDAEGYRFVPERSGPRRLVFGRDFAR